jgi:hypothetical protein
MSSTALVANYLNAPTEDGDFVEYMNWVCNSTKQGFEGVAEVTGYRVPPLNVPAPVTTLAHDALTAARATVRGLDQPTEFNAYQQRALLANVTYMERIAAYGATFADDYLDAVAAIIGHRPRDVKDADQQLEAHVNEAAPDEDERLFEVLCADTMRRCFMLAIPGSTYYRGLTEPLQPWT